MYRIKRLINYHREKIGSLNFSEIMTDKPRKFGKKYRFYIENRKKGIVYKPPVKIQNCRLKHRTV